MKSLGHRPGTPQQHQPQHGGGGGGGGGSVRRVSRRHTLSASFVALTTLLALSQLFKETLLGAFLPTLSAHLPLANGSGLQPVGYESVDTSAPVETPPGLLRAGPYSSSLPAKMAFLFLTVGPMPLTPLWNKFFQGHEHRASVYVHSSGPSPWTLSADGSMSPLFQGRNVPSAQVVWGDISMVDAERRLVRAALLDPLNLFFVLASDSCAPLWPLPYVFNYLATSPLSFVESYECPLGIGYGRYSEGMQPEVTKDNFRKGSQWFALQRRHAEMVNQDSTLYPKFKQYCRLGPEHRNCYSDEHYIQTLLTQRDPHGLANYSVTFADWSEHRWHPRMFTQNNITVEDLRTLKNEKRFIRWRSYWFRVRRKKRTLVIDNKTDRPLVVPDGGVCKIEGRPRHCFLFGRKFHASTLGFLMTHSQTELGF